jgi:hypothetical protein
MRGMSAPDLSLAELTKFGITPDDERPHPFSPDYEWWNESVFYDWYDASGANAGHCRIGWHPNQQRLWVWLFLFNGTEWVAIEEPRLPFSSLKLPAIAYDDGWGLKFSYTVKEPLRSGRFEIGGFGRVISGPRAGMILPVSAALDVTTVGAAHSHGQSTVAGHKAEQFSTSRFEQPIRAHGVYTIGTERRTIDCRGERDHSWGPRLWNMEWNFLVLNNEALRAQCVVVRIPDVSEIRVGYLNRTTAVNVNQVELDLTFDDTSLQHPVRGRFALQAEDGDRVAGTIESISGAEIDITHTFVPPRRSVYRRTLVRCTTDDGQQALGWLESNRFVD